MMSGFEIFENVVEIHQEEAEEVSACTTEQKMVEYIKKLEAIEVLMDPLKDNKRDLKKEFKEEGWLTGDEISMTVKAYRMMKTEDFDFDEFTKIYEALSKVGGRP